MTCNQQLRVLGNPGDGRGNRETKQHLKGRRGWKKTKQQQQQDGQKLVILLHTQAITETKSSLGGEIRERQEERGKPEEAQETKPLASVFTMHVKQTTMT